MNEKHAAICKVAFLPVKGVKVESPIGATSAKLVSFSSCIRIPSSSAELQENRKSPGEPVDVQFVATLTDTSPGSLELLRNVTYLYGLLILQYTDGSFRLLGTPDSPILVTYEKNGTPAVYELQVSTQQPEFSKTLADENLPAF